MSEDKKAVETKDESHKRKMQNQKEKIDAKIAASDEERGVMILLTGDGKGKSSSAFGMVVRALGYGDVRGRRANRTRGRPVFKRRLARSERSVD